VHCNPRPQDVVFVHPPPQSPPGGHAGLSGEHPPGGVHPVPVPGPTDAAEPHGEHRVQPVAQRVRVDGGGVARLVRGVLVRHPHHDHRGQLPGVRHHHQRPVVRRPLQERDHHPGAGAAVHRADGAGGGRGPDPHHQGEPEAVQHEEAAQLLPAAGLQPVTDPKARTSFRSPDPNKTCFLFFSAGN